MRTKFLLLGSLFLALTVSAYADTFVNMTLTGNGLDSWGGEYVSPYSATSNSHDLQVACLDLTLTTNIGTPYSYDISTPANGDNTPWQNYQAAAILTKQVLGAVGDQRGELSFAIWYIFNPGAVTGDANSQVQANLLAIENYANNALTQAGHGVGIPNFIVYYPGSSDPVNDPPGSQRFINLVPDGGMTLMLLGGTLVGVGALRRKFRV